MVLEVNDAGELVLPPELVQAASRMRLQADRAGEALLLKPIAGPEELPSALEGWPTFPAALADPTRTFRREDIYGDEGR